MKCVEAGKAKMLLILVPVWLKPTSWESIGIINLRPVGILEYSGEKD